MKKGVGIISFVPTQKNGNSLVSSQFTKRNVYLVKLLVVKMRQIDNIEKKIRFERC